MTAAPRAARRRIAVGLVLAAVLSTLTVIGPVAGPTADPGSAAGAVRTFGNTPLDDVLYWADHHKACGLSRDRLAALMLAVTWPESGAPWNQGPSPMTLSRWDNQPGLHSFGSSGIYTAAFWHPGIGMFAFDSAGGWGMTAAARISSWSSSQQAAATMAARWCNTPTREYVWLPWHACTTGKCRAIYDAIYQGGVLTNLARDVAIGRNGGMEERTCVLDFVTVQSCWFVDPARAQGYRGFVNPAFGPSPISDPFYVWSSGGEEVRTWMREDTGYHTDITARKPLGANARTSVSWGFSRNLCDHAGGKGDCGTFIDVSPLNAFFDEIEWMASTGLSAGFPDGTFRPTIPVTRQAMAAFLYRLSGSPPHALGEQIYSDVVPGSPFSLEIDWLTTTGLAEGYPDGTFRPTEPVTRQAMAAFLHRLAGAPPGPFPNPGFTDVGAGHQFALQIAWMAHVGITSGFPDGSFGAGLDVVRQAMAAFLFRVDACCV